MEFINGVLEVKLIAQSPMLHFQGKETGATLRGSELKPKLDRFILKKLEEEGEKKLPESAYVNQEKAALNYKLTLTADGNPNIFRFEPRNFNIVYGDRKNKVLLMQDTKIRILCMNKELQNVIVQCLNEFFTVTNFGYMQNKGFGSFILEESREQWENKKEELRKEAGSWLKKQCGAEQCYYIDLSGSMGDLEKKYNEIFRQIKDFYDLLKTGRNFKGYSKAYIYQYMLNKKIHNEKAWMKANKIAPAIDRQEKTRSLKKPEESENARYVRALLGVGAKVEYLNDLDLKKYSEKVLIKIKNKDIERMESPVFFKVILDHVFICARRIPEEIYEKEFRFSSSVQRPRDDAKKSDRLAIRNERSGNIHTPSKEELCEAGFSIDDLLEQYVKYYNEMVRKKKLSSLVTNKEVKQCEETGKCKKNI